MASGRTRKRKLVITKRRYYRVVQGYPCFLMSGEEAFCTKRVMALGCWIFSQNSCKFITYICVAAIYFANVSIVIS
jgi:hypothetical protein